MFHNRCLFPEKVYCTETRPYNQGARLTAYELVHDKIPGTLICDDMAAAALKTKQITAVVVGADRIAANGDTANKIGTYQVINTTYLDSHDCCGRQSVIYDNDNDLKYPHCYLC